MSWDRDISPELRARVDAIVARSARSFAEVVEDALQNGHSLEWQERFLDKVAAGAAAADRGDFASPAEVERVLNKYRPA
jgi:predicted transcriptional regulator